MAGPSAQANASGQHSPCRSTEQKSQKSQESQAPLNLSLLHVLTSFLPSSCQRVNKHSVLGSITAFLTMIWFLHLPPHPCPWQVSAVITSATFVSSVFYPPLSSTTLLSFCDSFSGYMAHVYTHICIYNKSI